MLNEDVKTIEQGIAELEAELQRAAQREYKLLNELAHKQERYDVLWEVVSYLYRQAMPFRCERVKRWLPELATLDVNHVSQSDR